ncbi:MAG TPA: pyridoxamine 5'-phosphate oxidase family protein [Acidimicrobiales bacterium]|nr:pyridoxamine 5'-phosphate oxidase family protein [Acidimicrobiales bacterium]
MGRTYEGIDERQAAWMQEQPVFFVATAPLAGEGHVNCSPKGNRREFLVTGERQVMYLEQTGSGVETVAHLRENGRIVIMFCAFDGAPRIVRLHGRGRAVLATDAEFADLQARFPGGQGTGVRSVVVVDVERISDSCGYGVPLMPLQEHRRTMDEWASRKGADGVREYWTQNNSASIDGLAGVPAGS